MGVREVCGSEIVFQRQICKPLEQLVSSFHSDETTAAYVRLLFQDQCSLRMNMLHS